MASAQQYQITGNPVPEIRIGHTGTCIKRQDQSVDQHLTVAGNSPTPTTTEAQFALPDDRACSVRQAACRPCLALWSVGYQYAKVATQIPPDLGTSTARRAIKTSGRASHRWHRRGTPSLAGHAPGPGRDEATVTSPVAGPVV